MENNTSSRYFKPKESRCGHPHIRHNRLQAKKVTRDKNGQYIITKGTIHQEDIIVINTYTPNIGTPKYIKQLLTDLKGKLTATQ